jgi:hypothetical protein
MYEFLILWPNAKKSLFYVQNPDEKKDIFQTKMQLFCKKSFCIKYTKKERI